MNSETPDNHWDTVITYLFRPRLVLQGMVEYLLAWSFTRGWWKLILIHSAPLLLLLGTAVVVGYGASLRRTTLIERYDKWVAAELPDALRQLDESADGNAAETSATAAPAEDPSGADAENAQDGKVVSQYGELLLRRLLKLQNSNSRITYLVADQLARQDRLGQARQMMRRIAPTDSSGFTPAHAWLAGERLRGKPISTIAERDRLLHDLSLATQWNGSPVGLFSIYAKLLDEQGKTSQAMQVLEQAGAQQSSVNANLLIAELAAKHRQTGRLRRAAEAIKQEIGPRRENNTATATELASLANVLLLEEEPQQAREIAIEGLRQAPNHPLLLRILSEAYRFEYLQSFTRSSGKTEVNLALLDAALKADPSNPAVGTEIARLISLGQDAPPELKAALEQQLAAGQSTALTHILLANRSLATNDLAAAEPHLELALRHAPNTPAVMNNLALVLARTKPTQLDRALQLSMTACQAAPTSGQFRDTLGEIRARMGDQLGAIESYEAAIGLQPNLLTARQRLAELYRELGMNDMADAQLRELERLPKLPPIAPTEEGPSEASPTEASPTEASPTEASPTEASPKEASPKEASPTEASPTEASPTEASPTEASPTEEGPTEEGPTEEGPIEEGPVEKSSITDNAKAR